ncbi:N-6 DNA methylase [Thermomonospora umbrina]|uniref:N-6 DNA methylase n=1 Tax=Thermomonospora umbrina TaxID=111806 RepID=A0A3D9T9W1_9ACTN|nr:N-6 DNA methylase [Thermomonospora umbrina]REF00562.1 N-6 DNA methylase [Thermomonospora umbrina]
MAPLAPDIAEAVSAAWHNNHGGTTIEIPTGVVASLALVRQKPGTPDIAEQWRAMTGEQFLKTIRWAWAGLWFVDPYLTEVAGPLHKWVDAEVPERTMHAVRAVANAAMRAGLFRVTGHADPSLRADEDVLGHVLTWLRSHGQRKGLGEFHTPPDVSALTARMGLLDAKDLVPGSLFSEDTAGTGGIIRAQAQTLRNAGGDPAKMRWYMGDIDPIAVACAAINAVIWGLGPNVLCWCGDVIKDPTGPQQALRHRRDAWTRRRNVIDSARLIHATRRAEALLRGATSPDTSGAA